MSETQQTMKADLGLLRVLVALLAIVLTALLRVFGVSLLPLALVSAAAGLVWIAFRYSTTCVGLLMAFMPIFPVAFLVGKLVAPSYISGLAGIDRAALLFLALILLWKNGAKLTLADGFLLLCFALALVRFLFDGIAIALFSDFNFIVAYFLGRVTVLTSEQEDRWATRAVWLIAILAILGTLEVFVIGEAPRTFLYLTTTEGGTDRGSLLTTFRAEGFSGLRESATMFGPLQFAATCMAALMIWWVYSRKLWLALMIMIGLICSVTRSAWIGTAVAIPFIAVAMNQRRRLVRYIAPALLALLLLIPILGLTDYITLAKSGSDASSEGHLQSLVKGAEFIVANPMGVGAGNAGSYSTKSNENGVFIEDTYLTLAAEYGILSAVFFIGFIVSALWLLLKNQSSSSFAAAGILVSFAIVMVFAPLHQDFPLASWIWFPVGYAIRKVSLGNRGAGTPPLQPLMSDSPNP
jgi:hypothetical protein